MGGGKISLTLAALQVTKGLSVTLTARLSSKSVYRYKEGFRLSQLAYISSIFVDSLMGYAFTIDISGVWFCGVM